MELIFASYIFMADLFLTLYSSLYTDKKFPNEEREQT